MMSTLLMHQTVTVSTGSYWFFGYYIDFLLSHRTVNRNRNYKVWLRTDLVCLIILWGIRGSVTFTMGDQVN